MTIRILAKGRWPAPDDPDCLALPPLPGFTASSFNPLVAETAERCLRAYGESSPADVGTFPGSDGRTALLLASRSGDLDTARAIDAAAADPDRRVPPLLFFQSNPNAVLGHIAARHRLTGPVVAVRPGSADAVPGEVPPDILELAALLLADGDADRVLVIAAEQADRTEHPEQRDRAVAVLVAAT